jgi:hypothetical protein
MGQWLIADVSFLSGGTRLLVKLPELVKRPQY